MAVRTVRSSALGEALKSAGRAYERLKPARLVMVAVAGVYFALETRARDAERELHSRQLDAEIRQAEERLAIERYKLGADAITPLPQNFRELRDSLTAARSSQGPRIDARKLLS